MTPREFLDLEVSLLLLKHGQRSLLHAVARRMRLSDKELELELEKVLSAEHTPKKKSPPRPFVLGSVLAGREEKTDLLRQLNARFENRTFLSELKDINRFFERRGKSAPKWKSRVLAQTSLFQFLADLDILELQKILADHPTGGEVSSLGLISDEILGRNKGR